MTPDQVESALNNQREQGGRFGEALVRTGGASEIDVCWALSRQLGMPLIDLQTLRGTLVDFQSPATAGEMA